MAWLPNATPPEKTPEVAMGQGIWALLKSLMAQVPQTVMDPAPVALTQGQVLNRLFNLSRDSLNYGPESQLGFRRVIQAIEKGLFGPKTYEPIDKILVGHPDRNLMGYVSAAQANAAKHPSLYPELITNPDLLDSLRKNSAWSSVLSDYYQKNKVIPFGMMSGEPLSVSVSASSRMTPAGKIVEGTVPLHEFSHAAHLAGDTSSPVMGVVDKVASMTPSDKAREAMNLINRIFGDSALRPDQAFNYRQSVLNPNEAIAERSMVDILSSLGDK